MAVNNQVAAQICKRYFRGISYNESSRKYFFSLNTLSKSEVDEFVREMCCNGNSISASEVFNFIDQTVGSTPVSEEWSAINTNLIVPGEVLYLAGKDVDGKFLQFRLLKMNRDYYLCWTTQENPQTKIKEENNIGILALPVDLDIKKHSPIELRDIRFNVTIIKFEHPSRFHRLIDTFMLDIAYIENSPVNLLPLYNELKAFHDRRQVASNFGYILEKVSENGISTYCLRKILNYICIDS